MKTSLSNPVLGAARFLVFFLVLATASLRLSAQGLEGEPQPTYKIGSISVRFLGAANVNEQVVRANMQVREGMELDDTMIDRDIRSLYRTGLFEFIDVKRENVDSHTVNLVVEVTPKFRVLTVKFEGNKRVRSRRLEKEVKSKANSALDERQVKEDSEKIREYYQKTGYNQATVNYSIERNRETGFGVITFKIREGERVKISDIRFIGNEHIKARKLRKQMETKKYGIFSWLLATGRLKDEQFEDDLEKLRDYYRDEGYLDVEIAPEKVVYDYPKNGKLVITIPVSEGRQYHIGDITFTGNKLHPTQLLRFLLRQQPGMVFSPTKLDEDVTLLEDFYGRDGYLDTRVRLIRKPNVKTGNIDIEYNVEESEQFFVESIKIEGNTKTKSTVILRELALGPGEVFNVLRMKASKQRLENTRFFEEGTVNVTPESTNIPNRRNLKVALREGRTGNLTFGLGFSSLEQGVIFAELTQSNFDLFNRRSLFQGAGQKFRLRLQYGARSNEIILSLEEPWLFQKELSLGGSVFRTSSNLDNQLYDQVQTGGEIYLRKRLFELVEGRISYSYRVVSISNVDPSLQALGVLDDKQQISTVGFQMVRDTRDKIVNTTAGNRMELTTEVSGGPFGGNLDFYRLEFRGSQFFPLFQTQAQSLGVIGRAGVVDAYGDTPSLPYFERYFIGGPYSLRGFENRDVGPKDSSGVSLGGKSYGMLTLEYSADIVSPVRFAVFYDAGFVNLDPYDFTPGGYNDDFGVGLRLFIAGAPLSLDYGIPLTHDRYNKKGGQFNFSFGTRF
ncbi:MAG TPA: outer membrane protein assembly factor BamA [Opitutaceae bacterium]|nr:outer membrane protein assembly factor BamA [Opitutaceae bacterium]